MADQPSSRKRRILSLGAVVALLAVFSGAGGGLLTAGAAVQEPPPADPAAQRQDALMNEEALARFQQVLRRRPFHDTAFDSLTQHYTDQGNLNELIEEYRARAEALSDDLPARIVLARLLLRADEPQEAADLIDAIDQLPEDLDRYRSDLLTFKAAVYRQLGRQDDALRMIESALDDAATIAERIQLVEALADLHLQMNQPDEAAGALAALAEEYPDQYLHRRRVAEALVARRLHDAAVDQFQAMLELAANEPDRRAETLRQLGGSLEALDRTDDAIEAYLQAMALLAGDHWMQRELHERVVGLYRAAGRLDELETYARDQVERAPEQITLRLLLADVQTALGKPDAVRATLAQATELFPANLVIADRNLQFLERQGMSEEVAAEYERIIAQHPDNLELYIAYGQFLASQEESEAARNQWRHVLNSELTTAGLAVRLGMLFEANELELDAIDCYERAIDLSPAQPEAYLALSRLWMLRDDRAQAVQTLEQALARNADDAAVHASVAQALLSLGEQDRALEAVTRAAELDPAQTRYHDARADLLIRAGRLDEALAVRRATLDRITSPVQQSQSIEVVASMYRSAGQLEELVEQETTRLEENPADVVALLLLARASDLQREFPAAREYLERALEADPQREEARVQLARLHDAVGDIDAAIAEYRRLIDSSPARSRQYYQAIADLKLRYNDRLGAIETFDRIVQTSPDNASVLKDVAEQLVRLVEPERALEYYERSLQLQPGAHDVRLAYGEALGEAGRLEDALAAYRAAAMQPTDRETAETALTRLHETAGELGLVEDLLEEMERSVERDPENTLVARTLAQLLIREFEYGRAMSLLDLMQRYRPRDVEIALVRADLLRRLADFDEAIDQYRQVLRIPNVDRDFVLGEMGKAAFEAGRVDEARRYWRQVGHKVYAGSLLRNNGLIEDAIEVYREGIRFKPDDFGLHRNLVNALQEAGRTEEALDAARRLLDLQPDNVYNIQGVAKSYLDIGDRESAAEVAGRLFSAAVAEQRGQGQSSGSYQSYGGAAAMYAAMGYAGYGYGYGGGQSNLQRGVAFFMENGLLAELEQIIAEQLELQPDNAVLRQTAVGLFSEAFNKPQMALQLLRDLESAEFPVEHQVWLGQSSQSDYMRMQRFNLIARKPALRDQRLTTLEQVPEDERSPEQLVELAAIRISQGLNDRAIELLERAVEQDADDVLALSSITTLLIGSEQYAEARPYASRLRDLLAAHRDRIREETIERIRRDFVRSLPLQMQLRVTDELLEHIAEKWTLGMALLAQYMSYDASVQALGFFQAQMALARIEAESDDLDAARARWRKMTPSHPADAESWTLLADVAQRHDQQDLAFEFYQNALAAQKVLSGDPLLQQVFSGTFSQMFYGGGDEIDAGFNKIVESFAANDQLTQLYEFLREIDQSGRAHRVAEQYDLYDELIARHESQFERAVETFRAEAGDPLERSVPLFAAAAKLAELYDHTNDWDKGRTVYERYLSLFPDELALLQTFGELAESQRNFSEAIEWEERALEARQRLSRNARAWMLRSHTITPAIPRMLANQIDSYEWASRWSRDPWSGAYGLYYGSYGYGSSGSSLDQSGSWLRIARLHLADDNPIAAGEAMQHAVGTAGARRDGVVTQVLSLIQDRQLTEQMLPVLRTLAIHAPTQEPVQLAFAQSLEANERTDVAIDVYRRMMRRGVSDLSVLAQVRQRLEAIDPEATAERATLASLEAEVEADPGNLKRRLRLAKAYFYSLQMDQALEIVNELRREAPHLEGVHDLAIEIYTIRNDTDQLTETLREKIARASDESNRHEARRRLVEVLFAAGQDESALEALTELADPRQPWTYQMVGLLLHYFGRHDEAIEQVTLAGQSQATGQWNTENHHVLLARSHVLKGDFDKAAELVMTAVTELAAQSTQYGGVYGMYNTQEQHFNAFSTLFLMHPEVAAAIRQRLEETYEENPRDLQNARLLVQFHRQLGRADLAEELLDELIESAASDQTMVTLVIERAIEQKEYDRAIELATAFIEQQPKPTLPPGIPVEYAGEMILSSPRNAMLCRLGDVYWEMDEREKAFEAYGQIVDEEIEATKLAYAGICALYDRVDEARQIVDEALEGQQIKSAQLLNFRATLAAIDGNPRGVFDTLAETVLAEQGDQAQMAMMYMDYGSSALPLLAKVALEEDMIDEYVEVMRTKIEKDPHDWSAYSQLADALWEAGRIVESNAVLDEAAQLKPIMQQALTEKLNRAYQQREPEQLRPLMEQLIELQQSATDVAQTRWLREELGRLFWHAGEQERAMESWTARMNLQEASTHLRLAALLLQVDAFDEAEQACRRALDLNPDLANAHRMLAKLLYERGEDAEALTHLSAYFTRSRESESENVYSSSSYSSIDDLVTFNNDGLRLIALDVADGLEAEPAPPAESALAVTALTGDWPSVGRLVDERRENNEGQYDPLIWSLRADALLRAGDWPGAVDAMEFMRRLTHTTLSDRREQLQLVLAGEQIREAAAGSRTAGPAGAQMPPGMQYPGSMYYGGYSPYNSWYWGREDLTDLAALYVRLGQYEQAERLFLLVDSSNPLQSSLPTIATIMWDQQEYDRALELMRTALLMTPTRDLDALCRYGTMLAQAGRRDEAVALLRRAYEWQDPQQSGYSYYYYGGYAWSGQGEFENGEEQVLSTTLSQILSEPGEFDRFIESLRNELDQSGGQRMAKLVVALQIRGERWEDAAESLAVWLKDHPDDLGARVASLRVLMQLGRWSDALVELESVRAAAPEQADRWRVTGAFVHLMNDDADAAVRAVKPMLTEPRSADDAEVQPAEIWLVLALAGDDERLCAYLEMQRDAGLTSDWEPMALAAGYIGSERWADAMRLSFEQFWRQPSALSVSSGWGVVIGRIVALMEDAEVDRAAATAGLTATERAVLALYERGATDDAVSQLSAVIESGELDGAEMFNARRAFILAAVEAGRLEPAAEAVTDLVNWLRDHQDQIWQSRPTMPIGQRAAQALEQLQSAGAAGMLSMGQSMNNLLSGIYEYDVYQYSSGPPQHIRYRQLLAPCAEVQRQLVLQAYGAARAEELIREHYRIGLLPDTGYNPYGSYASQQDIYDLIYYQQSYRTSAAPDAQQSLRELLQRHRRFDDLIGTVEQSPRRVPVSDWLAASESYAAAGDASSAKHWRDRHVQATLARMSATDRPQLSDRWLSYGWYNMDWRDRQAATQIRIALDSVSVRRDDEGDGNDSPSRIRGHADSLWEMALLNEQYAQHLEQAEPSVGPGWGETQTLRVLVDYYAARDEPRRVIELLDRAFPNGGLVRSQMLQQYLQACLDAGDDERVSETLDEIESSRPAMRDRTDLLRLMLLRHEQRSNEADALEQDLLSRCGEPRETGHELEGPGWSVVRDVPIDERTLYSSYQYSMNWLARPMDSPEQLAQVLGVQLASSGEDLTLTRADIREAYQRHGLYNHALRILNEELEAADDDEARLRLEHSRVNLLQRAGHDDEVARAAAALIEELRGRVESSNDWGGDDARHLFSLYRGDDPWANPDAALQLFRSAKQQDPAYDPMNMQEAALLFRLERYDAAWSLYRTALATGRVDSVTAQALFEAGLAAHHAGDGEHAVSFLRQALWRDPAHELAGKSREVLDE